MSLLKYFVLGAAVVYGTKYLTKKRTIDGKSILDDFKAHGLQLKDQIETLKSNIEKDLHQTTELY